ncbi:hypothetical protein EDD86DRAFT_188647 [Gorgonomyces haynaldii]|nr:hypothetical protein EDD86DRAFT_188647 [Gorgonomyces haynaldii]
MTLYRSISKLIRPLSQKNGNMVWQQHLEARFRVGGKQSDALALYSFLEANKNHKEMMERYWPTSGLSNEEKLQKTAERVGLQLPKTFLDQE